MAEWQQIKEYKGGVVLVCRPPHESNYFFPVSAFLDDEKTWRVWGSQDDRDIRFVSCLSKLKYEPTHWMKLPTPPKE